MDFSNLLVYCFYACKWYIFRLKLITKKDEIIENGEIVYVAVSFVADSVWCEFEWTERPILKVLRTSKLETHLQFS